MVPWIGVQLTWVEVMFVCLKPVAAVIVAPRWASYSSPRGYLRSLKIQQFNNSYSLPTRSHITGSDITIVIKHNSMYHTVPEKRAQVSESNENH
jgi:hypothetical protein